MWLRRGFSTEDLWILEQSWVPSVGTYLAITYQDTIGSEVECTAIEKGQQMSAFCKM